MNEKNDEEIKDVPSDTSSEEQVSERTILSTGIRVGTLVKTKDMENFIGRTRPDGLHILNLDLILSRINVAGTFISRIEPKRIVVCSAREYGKTPVETFCSLTGAIPIIGRFMPGTFTNPLFSGHIDPELAIVLDPLLDIQVVAEASKIGVPVIAICDSDNVTSDVDLIIPGNNRGRRSIAAIFWLLAKKVLTYQGVITSDHTLELSIEDFETKIAEE